MKNIKIEKISRDDLFKLENDYIFHGSPFLFEICKPHKAKCDSKNPSNEQTAIYGANNLKFAIVLAFEKLPKDKYSWKVSFINGKCVAELIDGTYIDESAKGYLYCFEKSKFKPTHKNSTQYVCFTEIKPLKIFEINYKDYADLFIKTITKIHE